MTLDVQYAARQYVWHYYYIPEAKENLETSEQNKIQIEQIHVVSIVHIRDVNQHGQG